MREGASIEKILGDERVEEISDERPTDGFWIYLKPGYQWDGNHQVHDHTPSKALQVLRREVKPCDCERCVS